MTDEAVPDSWPILDAVKDVALEYWKEGYPLPETQRLVQKTFAISLRNEHARREEFQNDDIEEIIKNWEFAINTLVDVLYDSLARLKAKA